MTGQRLATIERIREQAADGLTRPQAAEKLGLSYSTVVYYAIENDIEFVRSGKQTGPTQRTREMAILYQSGQTLKEIGDQYGVARERVRQLLEKFHGLSGKDGGQTITATLARAARLNKVEALHQLKWGCSRAQYQQIKSAGGTACFTTFKNNANRFGYKLDLTLWQWWTLWQDSGHWNERGRGGRRYWMFRLRSAEPLSVDNYCIATGSEAMIRKRRRDRRL